MIAYGAYAIVDLRDISGWRSGVRIAAGRHTNRAT
jgi:hypothetical protein